MKRKIGQIRNKALVEGDVNLLSQNEILVTHDEGYTLLRERTSSGIRTSVVIPVQDLPKK